VKLKSNKYATNCSDCVYSDTPNCPWDKDDSMIVWGELSHEQVEVQSAGYCRAWRLKGERKADGNTEGDDNNRNT